MNSPATASKDTLRPRTIAEVQEAVRTHRKLLPRGGGSKPALSTPTGGAETLELAGLAGVLEYDPSEFTFTALAGTRLAEVARLLAENGQYLPFDPPLAGAGATLGGTVASGLSGPGRVRYGGVRDFILGVRMVTAAGELARAGGKVVKNSAGCDLPKLMVGSMGRLGVIAELSFKVFPAPKAYTTLKVSFDGLEEGLSALLRLSTAPFDLEALELEPPGTLLLRIGGLAEALPPRVKRLESFLARAGETLTGEEDAALWQGMAAFDWLPDGAMLVKVPLTPRRIPSLDAQLEARGAGRRYSVAGNLVWIAWPDDIDSLAQLLSSLDLSGLIIKGPPERPWLGKFGGQALLKRIKSALDPDSKFLEI
ncbi:FAD-binding protein [soil metagenome]